jgi:spore maturation protein CgeB
MPDGMFDQLVRRFDRSFSMEVLYLGPRFDYGNPRRGLGFEESTFLDSLLQLPVNVTAVDLGAARRVGIELFNRALLDAAHWQQPAAVFAVLHRDEVTPQTLDSLRTGGAVVINWFTDDHWRYDDFSRGLSPHLDLAVTTSRSALERYQIDGLVKVHKSQWACNPRLFRPILTAKTYDVGFAGQVYGKRAALIASLKAAGFDVRAWGLGWPAGRLTLYELVRAISEARVFLNFGAALAGGNRQVKGRDFEVPACRTALLTDTADELSEYFVPGEEVAVFDGPQDLQDRIRDLIADPTRREEIARRGYDRATTEHTYVARLRATFDAAGITMA